MDETIASYFGAWNEQDAERRRLMLENAVTDEVELLDPTGRWKGVDELVERIGRYQSSAPGTEVVPAGGVDAHNNVARYRWRIVDPAGQEFMEGLDVVERADDRRLKRILMFHGPVPQG